MPDDQAATQNGYATIVISDPSNEPSASVLSQWGATWLAWGALEYSTDFLYNMNYQPLTSAEGAFYYNVLIYRPDAGKLILPAVHGEYLHVATFPETGGDGGLLAGQRILYGCRVPVSRSRLHRKVGGGSPR